MGSSRLLGLFGRRLKLIRTLTNLTQEVMAERVGISVTHLSKIERGLASPSFEVVERMCSVLHTTPADLFIFPPPEGPTRLPGPTAPHEGVVGRMPTGFVSFMGSWSHDVASGRDVWSDGLFLLLGYGKHRPLPSYRLALDHVVEEHRDWAVAASGKALEGHSISDLRLRFRRRDGESRRAVVYAESVTNGSGATVAIHALVLDVTDWVDTEDSLLAKQSQLELQAHELTVELQSTRLALATEAAQRVAAEAALTRTTGARREPPVLPADGAEDDGREAVRRLCRAVAHEFNNLVAVVLGHADLLHLTLEPDAEAGVHAAAIRTAAERMAGLLHHLRLASRPPLHRPVAVDVHRLIAEVSAAVARELGASAVIRHELAAESAVVLGDPALLATALRAVLRNAVEAGNGSSEVVVASRLEPAATTSPHDRKGVSNGKVLVVSVRDSGGGLDEAARHFLFEPFFTTKRATDHKGVGLAAAAGVAASHRGSVLVDSQPGAGAVVSLRLPLVAPAATGARHAVARSTRAGRHNGHAVLVVDDEPAVLATLAAMLARSGLTVRTAAGGEEGIRVFAEHADDVALVILDVLMPDRSGAEVFRALRQRAPDLPVLFASGHGPDDEVAELLALAAVDFVAKPFRRDELLSRVERLLAP